MNKTSLRFAACVLIGLTISCSPEHDGLSGSPSLDITLNPNPDPALAAAAANILGPKCVSCHGSAGPNQKFLNNSDNPGLEELSQNTKYVSLGQSDLSLLVQRSADGSMPPGNPLNSSEVQSIKDWIDDLATVNDNDNDNGNDNDPSAVTFTNLENQILAPKCYTCHANGLGGGLAFSDYASVRSSIVIPNSLDSALYQSTSRFSLPMPKNENPLTQAELALIEDWLVDGAQDN